MSDLHALLRERARLVAEAGGLKRSHAEVQAPARVEAVLANVRAAARQSGLDPDAIEQRYRPLIAAYTDWEARCFSRHGGAAAGARPLEAIRASIDALDREIVHALAARTAEAAVASDGDDPELAALVARAVAVLAGRAPG